jgi:hypothetical protein
MANMLTFNGVPVVTYGLTGGLLAFLTFMTFIDTNGKGEEEADASMAAVATASVPSFMLAPSEPSLVENDVTGPPSLMDGPPEDETSAETIPDTVEPKASGGNKKYKGKGKGKGKG